MAEGFSPAASEAKPFGALPGPKVPVLGALPALLKHGGPKGYIQFNDELYQKYGMISDVSMLSDRMVMVHDPREVLRVYQHEGKYPKGLVSDVWFQKHYFRKKNIPFNSFLKEGKGWQEGRHALQKDLFGPATADSYSTKVSKACGEAIQHLKARASEGPVDLRNELTWGVADLFTAAVLGRSVGTSGNTCSPENRKWVDDSMTVIHVSAYLLRAPYMRHWPELFAQYRKFEQLIEPALEHTARLTEEALQHYSTYDGPEESLPYIVRVARRGEIPKENLVSETSGILMAGLDTTYHVLLWNVVNLARNRQAQQTLREEVARVLGADGVFMRKKFADMPYLKAIFRETQRSTPAASLLSYRFLDTDLPLCGYNIPAGTKIFFGVEPIQKDPRIVDDPHSFKPERFLPEAVAARSDDPLKSIIDHRILSTPFSFGARMCPGGRLAELEIGTYLCKLVSTFDFKLEPDDQTWTRTMETLSTPDPIPVVKFSPL